MNKVNLKNRVVALEAEVKLLKRKAVGEPNFGVDDLNWRKILPLLKKVRSTAYKKVYG